ncbi:MAG: HU family DNA-binding protein [Deltaproteobacteria bacterium]|nr:HU family DNA-binding protein [Deltaproteobacteria bacterium]MBW2330194.1 HU family DNA-binding protein [Deltaproteobacteria bacterium]
MTKRQFVARIAESANIDKRTVCTVLSEASKELANLLAQGDSLTLFGLGTFCSVRKPRFNWNHPHIKLDGITMPSYRVPQFKPGAAFKAAVKGGAYEH